MANKLVLLLRRRIKALNVSFFLVANATITFFADVLEPIGPLVALFAWLALGLTLLVALLCRAILEPMSEYELIGISSPDGAAADVPPLPSRVEWAGDMLIFFGIGFALLGSVWILQQVVSPASAAGQRSDQGAFAALLPAVARMQQSLVGMDAKLDRISTKLDNVKRETSDDPRKELANLGVAWSGENFLNAVKDGDVRLVRLFLDGGIPVESAASQGRPLPVMLSLNESDPGEMLEVLVESGLDVDRPYKLHGVLGEQKTTLLGRAIEKGNRALVEALIAYSVDMNRPVVTFGQMGIPFETWPLVSAIYWKQFEIAELMIDAGVDISLGEYAAYRELGGLMTQPAMQPQRNWLERLQRRVAPPAAARAKADAQVRLAEVERELTAVALESLRAPYGSSQKRDAEERYNALQRERATLYDVLGETPGITR